MIRLGKTSMANLQQCSPEIQRLILEVASRVGAEMDFSVTCGHRGEADQEAAVNAKPPRSTKHWPDSLHNRLPSPAVDLAPYPVEWNDHVRFARLAGYVLAVADDLGIRIRWGADWNNNGRTVDEKFIDMPHFELKGV